MGEINDNKKISSRQLCILIIIQSLGETLVIIPYLSNGSFLTVAFAAVLNFLYAVFWLKLENKLGNKTLYDMASGYGNFFAKAVVMLLALKLIVSAGITASIASECIQDIMLNEMSRYVIAVFLIFFAVYCASSGVEAIGRSGEILFLFILVPVIFVYVMGIKNASASNIPFNTVAGKIFPLGFCFGGAEIVFISSGFVNGKGKGVSTACLISGIITAVITLISVAFFGVEYFTARRFAVLDMMYSVENAGFFIHRQEALVMCFWISAVFFKLAMYIFFASEFMKAVVYFKNKMIYSLVAGLIAVAISFVNNGGVIFYVFAKYTGLFMLILLPALLFVKGGNKSEN